MTSSNFCQGIPLSSFVFKFVIDILLKIALSPSGILGINTLTGDSLVGLEPSDDIVVFSEGDEQIQSFDCLKQRCKHIWGAMLPF